MGRKGYELHLIHNVRSAVELSGQPRRISLAMTAGLLVALAALLILGFIPVWWTS